MASMLFPATSCSTATSAASQPWSISSPEVTTPEDSNILPMTSTAAPTAWSDMITADPIPTTPIVAESGDIHVMASTSIDDLILPSDTITNITEAEESATATSELESRNIQTVATMTTTSSSCCLMSTSWDVQDMSADAVRMGDDAFFDIRPSLSSIVNKDIDPTLTSSSDLQHPSIVLVISQAIDRHGKHALDKKDLDDSYDPFAPTTALTSSYVMPESGQSAAAAVDVLTAALLAMTADPQPAADAQKMQDESKLAAGTIAGIALAGVGFAVFVAAALSVTIVRRVRRLGSKSYENQFANDNGGYLDSLQISDIGIR